MTMDGDCNVTGTRVQKYVFYLSKVVLVQLLLLLLLLVTSSNLNFFSVLLRSIHHHRDSDSELYI